MGSLWMMGCTLLKWGMPPTPPLVSLPRLAFSPRCPPHRSQSNKDSQQWIDTSEPVHPHQLVLYVLIYLSSLLGRQKVS